MKRVFIVIVYLWMATAIVLASSCSRGFNVEFLNNRTATLHLDSPCEQTLWLPIEDGAPNALLTVEGSSLMSVPMRVRLAVDTVEYYMPLRLEATTKRLLIENCSFENKVWDCLHLGKKAPLNVTSDLRQQLHFTPSIGWINDPNGMVYHDGEWHLFFQYNPLGGRWNNMSWGHAVSRDLIHWEELPVALYPDSLGQIYSGSAVIDRHNTAGFGKETMVALYTSKKRYQSQSLAYSHDKGRTFTKYEGNPVLPSTRADFRDPKVFWHEPTSRWIMPLACGNAMEFYSSENLREWHFESRFGDQYGRHGSDWECPDLFELPYGDTTKWVLLCSITKDSEHGSSVQYFVGDFDGHTFVCDTPENYTDWLNYGRDNYALVTWSNAPAGRRVAIGWQNNWQYANKTHFPTENFRGYMTLAYDLSLIEWEGRAKLILRPAIEYDAHFKTIQTEPEMVVEDIRNVYHATQYDSPLRLDCRLEEIDAQIVGLRLFNDRGESVEISFNIAERKFTVDRSGSGNVNFHPKFINPSIAPMSQNGTQQLTLILDRCSVECFTDIASTSDLVFPSEGYNRIVFYTVGGIAKIKDLKVRKLQ